MDVVDVTGQILALLLLMRKLSFIELRKNGEKRVYSSIFQRMQACRIRRICCNWKRQCSQSRCPLRNCISSPGNNDREDISDEPRLSASWHCFWGTRGDATEKKGIRALRAWVRILSWNFSESDFYTTDDYDTFSSAPAALTENITRVKKNHHSAVLMKCAENDPDFQRHIEIHNLFQNVCSSGAWINYYQNLILKTAHLLKTLGDLSLYSWLKCCAQRIRLKRCNRKVLEIFWFQSTQPQLGMYMNALFLKQDFWLWISPMGNYLFSRTIRWRDKEIGK